MDRQDVILYRERLSAGEVLDTEELKGCSPEERLRRLAACMRLAQGLNVFGKSDDDAETDAVRERWAKLRAARP